MLKIATWNVNSLNVRLPQLLTWLAEQQPDIVALQETKVVDEKFPYAEINAAGYQVVFSGQKTYNGVAILSRVQPQAVVAEIPDYPDPQRRVIAATIADLRVINLYVPNGGMVASDKYEYKLAWLVKLTEFLRQQLTQFPALVVLGDFNIAPADEDVYDAEIMHDQVLFSEPEKAAFQQLLALGLVDSFRLFSQPPKSFTWWDYRAAAFRRNLGLRIDHILLSHSLAKRCVACDIDKNMRKQTQPSDHAPVIATVEP